MAELFLRKGTNTIEIVVNYRRDDGREIIGKEKIYGKCRYRQFVYINRFEGPDCKQSVFQI